MASVPRRIARWAFSPPERIRPIDAVAGLTR